MQNSFQSQTEPLQNHHFPTLAMLDPNLHFNTQWLTHPIAQSHDGILVQLVPLFIPHLLQIEHALHFFRLNFQAVLFKTPFGFSHTDFFLCLTVVSYHLQHTLQKPQFSSQLAAFYFAHGLSLTVTPNFCFRALRLA